MRKTLLVAASLFATQAFACFATCPTNWVDLNSGCTPGSNGTSTWVVYSITGYTSGCGWPGFRSTRCETYTLNYTKRVRYYATNSTCGGEPDTDVTTPQSVTATRSVAC